MPDRYVIREIEGFLGGTNGKSLPGLSVCVLDSRVNYRLVREFQTERDAGRDPSGRILRRDKARQRVRARAAELARRLNADDEAAARRCPYCGVLLRTQNGLVCATHSDLPNLDPQLRRPKVQPAPVGVQPFTKGLS